MSIYQSKTAKLYQSGIELDEAVLRGADSSLFTKFEEEFNGGSIPVHLLIGFKYIPPYSCSYHTGCVSGKQLRTIAKQIQQGIHHGSQQ